MITPSTGDARQPFHCRASFGAPAPRWRALAALGLSLALTACGGGSEDGTATTDPAGDGESTVSALVGVWQADAADLFAANLASLGSVPLSCSGTMQLRFEDTGAFESGGDPVCTGPSMSGTGTLVSTGRYSNTDAQVTFSGVSNSGGVTVVVEGGSTFTLPLIVMGEGTASYSLSGNALTITFTDASLGTVTQHWTKVSG